MKNKVTRWGAVGLSLFLAIHGAAFAQDISADPQGSGAILGAARWIQGTLLGTLATVVAVIAVGVVGIVNADWQDQLALRRNCDFGLFYLVRGCEHCRRDSIDCYFEHRVLGIWKA